MKKILFLMLFVMCGSAFAEAVPPANYELRSRTDATRTRPYDMVLNHITIAATDSNDTALTSSTRVWDSLNVGTKFKVLDNTKNQIEVSFFCDGNSVDPASMSFNFKIYAARWYSSARVVCTGTALCGDLRMSRLAGDSPSTAIAAGEYQYTKWVSGITSFVDKWNVAEKSDYTESDNGISCITFDARGYGVVWCEITAIASNKVGNEIYCVCSGY